MEELIGAVPRTTLPLFVSRKETVPVRLWLRLLLLTVLDRVGFAVDPAQESVVTVG